MSLVEVIVATAIVALTAAMLLTAVGGVMNVARRGVDRQQAGDETYADLELGAGDASSATAVFRVGGQTYTAPGTVYETRDAETGVVFRAFVPD